MIDMDIDWKQMEVEKPQKEWILFIAKDPYCIEDRGYAMPEENRVLFPWGQMDFDEIQCWIDLESLRKND